MESQQVEHKKAFGKEVIISLVAFANTEGGKVSLGLTIMARHTVLKLARRLCNVI
jgi:predicted HTH transcriptional regulator